MELNERSNAQMYETGGMRRTHLKTHAKIFKRLIVHAAGFNLMILMRRLFGVGKPRVMQGEDGGRLAALYVLWAARWLFRTQMVAAGRPTQVTGRTWWPNRRLAASCRRKRGS